MDVTNVLGADLKTLANWERQRTEPSLRFIPAVLAFLGHDPRPEGTTFGVRLYRARSALGLSHRELAQLVGVDESTIWKWEAGRHRPIGRPRRRLAEVFKKL